MASAMRQDPLEAAQAILSRFDVAQSPFSKRVWQERRLQGMPLSGIAKTYIAVWGPDSPGQRSEPETYLGGGNARRRPTTTDSRTMPPSQSRHCRTVPTTSSLAGAAQGISFNRSVHSNSPGACANADVSSNLA